MCIFELHLKLASLPKEALTVCNPSPTFQGMRQAIVLVLFKIWEHQFLFSIIKAIVYKS